MKRETRDPEHGTVGGFTLVEVLVTLVAASLVLTAVYGAFLGSLSAKRRCEERSRTAGLGQAVLTLVRRDVAGALPRPNGHSSLEGTPGTGQGGAADRVEFVTTSDARRALEGRGSDFCEVGYRVEADPDAPGLLLLLRREARGLDDDPFGGGTLEVLAEGVSSFGVEYLAAEGEWTSAWTAETLPRAVRVTLVLRETLADGSWGRDREYRTLCWIPAGGP